MRDCVFNNSGCIEYAIVDYGNRLVPVPWGVANFDFGRRAFRVGITRDRLRDLPTFTNIAELNNAQFTQRVHSFYRGNQPLENGQRRMANPHDARPQAGQPQPAARVGEPRIEREKRSVAIRIVPRRARFRKIARSVIK